MGLIGSLSFLPSAAGLGYSSCDLTRLVLRRSKSSSSTEEGLDSNFGQTPSDSSMLISLLPHKMLTIQGWKYRFRRIYRYLDFTDISDIYIGGYFNMSINISEINKNTLKFIEILCKNVKMTLIIKYTH